MNGLLYSIYVNEITIINKLLKDEMYTKMANDNIINFNKKIYHETFNFVDDSTSVIGFHTIHEIK